MTKNKYLVFTSAGDNSNVALWLKGNPNFDVWVCYYGDSTFQYEKAVNYCTNRKGGKFQNFHHTFNDNREVFNNYYSVLIMDDDIIIGSQSINRLFAIHDDFNLKLLQPAYDRTGKISHPITARRPFSKMRYTNFIEIGVPIISWDVLQKFMDVYDPIVNCAGVDWWLSAFVIANHSNKDTIAICDSVWCKNPHDLDKTVTGTREIDQLESDSDRKNAWKICKKRNNLDYVKENIYVVYSTIFHISFYQVATWLFSHPANVFLRVLRKVKLFSSSSVSKF